MVTPHEFLQVGSETNGRYRGPQVTGGIPLFAPFGTGYYQDFGLAGGPSPHYTGPVFAPVVHKGAIALTSATTGGPHPSTSHREAAA
jgi:hypothetical protein